MARTKTGTTRLRRHKKILKLAQGYRQSRSKRYKVAKEAVLHAGEYAFSGRKQKRRNLRRLWIIRLSAAVKEHGISYNKFISAAEAAKILLNRKILADIAVRDEATFGKVVEKVKKFLQ